MTDEQKYLDKMRAGLERHADNMDGCDVLGGCVRRSEHDALKTKVDGLVKALGLIACRPLGGKTEDYFCASSLQDVAKEALQVFKKDQT